MLVLSRKKNERLHVGEDITITVVGVNGDRARLGIDAPMSHRIWRDELAPDDPRRTRKLSGERRELIRKLRNGEGDDLFITEALSCLS